ncbi:MAG: pilus assembly protein TadG-related protein [Chloroflexota bacterium]|nr:pilus assembly protein TadG-related protein [Chloroflexota bacterium]
MNSFRRFFGRDSGEEGQAVVLFAITMLALLFAVGLAIDAGQLYSAKRAEQEAADAAAFAGAVVLYQQGSGAQAITAARTDALTNGYSSGACLLSTAGPCIDAATQTTVTVYWPPISGSYVGNVQHIEVSITRQVKTSLVPAQAAFNPVRARGVAGSEPLNNGYAIMALDRGNTNRGFWTGNNGSVDLNGGGILVNSTSPNASENDACPPGAAFTVDTPYTLDVTGQATGCWSNLTPPVPVNAGHNQVPDPFAGFPKPSVCSGPLCVPAPTPVYTSLPSPVGGVTTLDPGVYKVSIRGSGNEVFHLNPGVYIVEAGFDTSGNGLVTGSGVFIYNTYSTYPAPPGLSPNCSDVSLTGNGDIDLDAMTTGTWKNLLFYQDPACSNDFEIGGNGNFNGIGSLYLPSALFMLDGNNATLSGSQLVARQVEIQQGNLTINYSPNNTAQPILPRLAE